VAVAFAAAGAAVGLGDLDEQGARRNAEAIQQAGGRALGVRLEVTDPRSIAEAVQAVERALGPIDILVNSAGITRSTPLPQLSLEEFDQVMGINVRGGLLCLQAVLPGMMERRRGSVIWLSSVAGKQGGGVFGSTHYACSKAAVIGLCQGAARELGPHRIRSNAIAPGLVLTGLVARSSSQDLEDQIRERVSASAPLRRAAEPEDIALAALYLASDASGYVTGEILDVNGGAYFD
jgi:NAD(P)-dependent dehydrogenase (short-subunit alcohol dehydrogenase family)